ncbi:hypothetical protein FH039_06320 [Thermococcus indicus]|uniref:Uncharacterized protein n=1 Tax=Thermococcus indicus TaxID=2586643 RepID=A0A4Y5SK15_9EURY|nr:hypothetical protein [Thermococcus indicus]QDA31287.1 hypothetical protein FH039_06320 [Thermococcus indicus]
MEEVEKIIARHKNEDPIWLDIQLAILLGKIDKKEALKRAKGVMKTSKSWQELEAEMYDELVP